MKHIVILYYDKYNKMKINNFKIPTCKISDYKDFQNEIDLLKNKYDITIIDDHKKSINYFIENKDKIDLVLNLADNGYENDLAKNGYFISLFNILGIKYTGRQANYVDLLERKDFLLYLYDYLGISYPRSIIYYPGINLQFLEQKVNSLEFPILVKMGISCDSLLLDKNSICYSFKEIINRIKYIEEILGQKNVILIQEFIDNAKEYTSLVLGNYTSNDVKVFTIRISSNIFYDYAQKNDDTLPAEDFYNPCDIENIKLLKEIEDKLIYLKKITHCKDYVRYDWLLDQYDRYYLIDLNANPAFDSELFRMYKKFYAMKNGIIDYVIETALKR